MGALKQVTRTFHAGEIVVTAGIYSARHDANCAEDNEIALLVGDTFPLCKSCGHQVQYQLLRHAPYLHEDEDFRKR